MSDAGLDAELHLTISAALEEVQRLQAALEAATEQLIVTITADTSELPAEIEAAVDGADTTAMVEGDAGEVTTATEAAVDGADTTAQIQGDTGGLTSSVTAAVDAADTTARVTGDAGDVTAAVTGAVDAADTTVTITGDLDLGAIQGEIRRLQAELNRLSQTSQQTTSQMSVSYRQVAQVVTGVLGAAFIQLGVDFNTLQQTSRAALTTVLGGAEAAASQMEELTEFTSTSPFPLDEFIRAQQILIAFGIAAEDVVPTLSAIQDAVAATGQDSAAIGEISTILAQINSTGQITADVFNQLGVRGIDAAQLIADEMGITAQEVRDQVTAGALDAQDALTALTAGMQAEFEGAAAGVRETWAGASDRVRAALRDISAGIAQTFIDPAGGGAAVDFANNLADALRRLEDGIVPVAQQMGQNLVPVLQAIGTDLLPAVVDAILAVAPAFGTATSAISLLAPIITVLAAALEAIPDPVLQMVAVFTTLQRLGVANILTNIGSSLSNLAVSASSPAAALRGIGTAAVTMMAQLRTAITAAITPANIALAALTAAFVIFSQAQQRAAEDAAEAASRVETLSAAFDGAEPATDSFVTGIQALVDENDEFATALTGLGLTAEQTLNIIRGGEPAMDAFISGLDEGAGVALGESDAFLQLRDSLEATVQEIVAARVANQEYTQAQAEQITQSDDMLGAFIEAEDALAAQREATERSTEAWLRNQLALGAITQDQAQVVRNAEDQQLALDELQAAVNDTSGAFSASQAIFAAYRDVSGATAQANLRFAEALRNLTREVQSTTAATGDIDSSLAAFAVAASSGAIASEDMEAAAAQLGVPLADLEQFVDAASTAVTEFADSAAAHFQTAAEVASGLEDEFTLRGFREELRITLEAQANFVTNIETLLAEGFPHLAQVAAESGPLVAASLVQPFETGNTGILQELEGLSADVDQQVGQVLPARLAAAGIGVITATGQIGQLATDAFGNALNMPGQAQTAVAGSIAALGAATPALFETGAGLGRATNRGWDQLLANLPQTARGRAELARQGILALQTSFATAGSVLGGAVVSGAASGFGRLAGVARSNVQSAVNAIGAVTSNASSAGAGIGAAVGQGLASGIGSEVGAAVAAARNLANAAVDAARSVLQVFSPSLVFLQIGEDTGAGFAAGLLAETDAVRAAAQELVGAAIVEPPDIPIGDIDPQIAGLANPAAMMAAGQTVINVQPGAVVIQVPAGTRPEEARELGRQAERGFAEALAQRQIRVDARSA